MTEMTHTPEEDFQHFLAYSNVPENAALVSVLRHAYLSGMNVADCPDIPKWREVMPLLAPNEATPALPLPARVAFAPFPITRDALMEAHDVLADGRCVDATRILNSVKTLTDFTRHALHTLTGDAVIVDAAHYDAMRAEDARRGAGQGESFSHETLEAMARDVFEAMRAAVAATPPNYGEAPAWVERGNSEMQQEARRAVTRLLARRAATEAASDG